MRCLGGKRLRPSDYGGVYKYQKHFVPHPIPLVYSNAPPIHKRQFIFTGIPKFVLITI